MIMDMFFRMLNTSLGRIANFIVNLPVLITVVYFISEFRKKEDETWKTINEKIRKFFRFFGIIFQTLSQIDEIFRPSREAKRAREERQEKEMWEASIRRQSEERDRNIRNGRW